MPYSVMEGHVSGEAVSVIMYVQYIGRCYQKCRLMDISGSFLLLKLNMLVVDALDCFLILGGSRRMICVDSHSRLGHVIGCLRSLGTY